MSTPLASKTTISSRNKVAQLSSMQPPSKIARNRSLAPPPAPPATVTRLLHPQPATESRPRSRLTLASTTSKLVTKNNNNHSNSSSISNLSSAIRKPSISVVFDGGVVKASNAANTVSRQPLNNRPIPDSNAARKGLAKFTNPLECQRQFQSLNLKIRQKDEIIEAREKEIDKLQEQLKGAINVGTGYATTVQYFACKLKLDSKTDLLTECEQLKSRVGELMVNEEEYENKLEGIVNDYKNHLKIEHDLRNNIKRELKETRAAHQNELDDLNERHSIERTELKDKIETLTSELDSKCKELANLRKEYEFLNNSFAKLEESLTKDKDARVKYAQEKVNQLQKDVDSLNSVLEMRLERIHALEKDRILFAEAQNEITTLKDSNKGLNQQIESLNAALSKKREQFENLIADHEKIRQELKRERKERRRMTMRTEQLEYVLNDSCASESNMVFNTTINSNIGSLDADPV